MSWEKKKSEEWRFWQKSCKKAEFLDYLKKVMQKIRV